jgi:integrase
VDTLNVWHEQLPEFDYEAIGAKYKAVKHETMTEAESNVWERIQSLIQRFQNADRIVVKGLKKLGVRLGNWLTAEQGQALWQAPDQQRLKGKRDQAMLALLLACGLRRHEAVALRLDHLQQREEHWAIVDLVGKSGHIRTVPVPDWVRSDPNDWLIAAGIDRGKLFRRVNKVGKAWGEGITEKAVGTSSRIRHGLPASQHWHLTICVGPALGCATLQEVSWIRSNSFWGMYPFRLLSAILAANSEFVRPSMIALASNRVLKWFHCFVEE